MEKVNFGGWANCVRLSNGKVELIVTTDVGPRVVRFGFVGGANLFREYMDQQGLTGGEEWRIYGGHRLWHAPEEKPRSYAPDNEPVKFAMEGNTLKICQPVEALTGIEKQMEITLHADKNQVDIMHRLINRNLWGVKLAPWCLSVMAQGGTAIIPQEPWKSHEHYLLPARAMVLWHYTDMADPRWTWGTEFIRLKQDPSMCKPQKIGIFNSLGWAGYQLGDDLFIKRFPACPEATYPDFGCNNEFFTNEDMLEVESVGPLTCLAPGGSVEQKEEWLLCKKTLSGTDAEIKAGLSGLL